MQPIIAISKLSKTYASGFQALKGVDLSIRARRDLRAARPERRRQDDADQHRLRHRQPDAPAPSRPTGTTSSRDYRAARSKIGLVPQELTTDAFETVWATVSFSRGLFGKRRNPAHIEKVLKDLSLWDKKDSKIMTLSGGMKRRVMIAKALSHEPQILFLDEPTAGVDVELRQDMWRLVRWLRDTGVTIILTTHYIDEAEEMADRIGVMSKGELILVEEKAELMRKLGKKRLTLHLQAPLDARARGPRRLRPRALAGPATSSSTPTTRRASAPASRRSCATSTPPASASRTCTPTRARSRRSSSAW